MLSDKVIVLAAGNSGGINENCDCGSDGGTRALLNVAADEDDGTAREDIGTLVEVKLAGAHTADEGDGATLSDVCHVNEILCGSRVNWLY